MKCMRASETREHRQEQNRMRMASMRESETFEKTVQRKERDRMRIASMRECETFEQTVQRKERDRMRMANNISNTLAFSPCNMPPLPGHT